MLTFMADKADERLDVFLTRMKPEFSRSHVQKLIADGQVTVNNVVRKGNYRLRLTDEVSFIIPEAEAVELLPEDIPLEFLKEVFQRYQ